eukprot:SAG25_NODE_540_length_7084_cov_4.278454_8_plen_177_part_00
MTTAAATADATPTLMADRGGVPAAGGAATKDVSAAVELQEEELETLRAIYDEELSVGGAAGAREVSVVIVPPNSEGPFTTGLALWLALPTLYPAVGFPPRHSLVGDLAAALDADHIAGACGYSTRCFYLAPVCHVCRHFRRRTAARQYVDNHTKCCHQPRWQSCVPTRTEQGCYGP